MYDLDRMREDINLKKILPYILSSDEIRYTGSTMYCKCVSGLHSETRYEHNAVSEKMCHCFSCGETYDAFTYIKKYYALQGFNLSFQEICEKIGDALGGSEMYIVNDDKPINREKLPLTNEELNLIGIHVSSKKYVPSLLEMYTDEPKKITKLLMKRAYESMMKYKSLSEQLENRTLAAKYMEMYKDCKEIYQKLGGEEESSIILFKL